MSATAQQYTEWVDTYKARTPHLLGKCKEAVDEMHLVFPELTPVPGHVETMMWGRREHWWLRAPDGKVVDPTRDQFISAILVSYEPWVPGRLVRTGRCMNCGDEIWRALQELPKAPLHECCCSDHCEAELCR